MKAYGKRVWALYRNGTLQQTDPKAYAGINYIVNTMHKKFA